VSAPSVRMARNKLIAETIIPWTCLRLAFNPTDELITSGLPARC
jgi:hypothetical protein